MSYVSIPHVALMIVSLSLGRPFSRSQWEVDIDKTLVTLAYAINSTWLSEEEESEQNSKGLKDEDIPPPSGPDEEWWGIMLLLFQPSKKEVKKL